MKGHPLIDIRKNVLQAKGSRQIFKSDIFHFLKGIGIESVLYIDMSCNDTKDASLIEKINRTKIMGGKSLKYKYNI